MEKFLKSKKNMLLLCITGMALIMIAFFVSFKLIDYEVEEEPRIFGATYMTMNNPYFTSLNGSIRNVVEAHGDKLITRDPAQNQQRQNEEILEMIDEGISVLFANPVDCDNVGDILKICRDRGVAVFVVDTGVSDTSNVISVIQSDQYRAGQLVARDMKKRFPDGARILALYHKTVASTIGRLEGFKDEISDDDRYKIVMTIDNTSEIEVANEEMSKLIKNFRDFDVVFGNNDPSALGALAALDRYGIAGKDILVYGVDGSPDGKKMIIDGKMAGTAAQYPMEMGRIAAETAYDYLEGKKVESNILVKVSMFTKDNLDENNSRGWQ
ncbi:MAG: sugar ABC transporter substrate-binding protein [Lachnospiraceae bacterium]|nr:sugar ABC transporter substrate-binding protein [Lachnospiraceae bacterium]